jgi:hypothetical protein
MTVVDERVQKILDAKGAIELELKNIPSAAPATLPESISKIKTELTNIETAAKSLSEVPASTRFQNQGAWAIHYSTVRMAVATLTVTSCVTIMALKWDAAKSPLVKITIGLAVMGCVVFMTFTYHTLKLLNKQLRTGGAKNSDQSDKKANWWKDIPLWIVVCLTMGQVYVGMCYWLPEAKVRDLPPPLGDKTTVKPGANSEPGPGSPPAVSPPANGAGTNSQSPR